LAKAAKTHLKRDQRQGSETKRIPANSVPEGAKRNLLGQVRVELGYGRGFVASVQGDHVEEGEGIAGSRSGIRVRERIPG
jgi:hypothetical protein